MAALVNVSFDLGEDWIINHTAYGAPVGGVATPLTITGATIELKIVDSQGEVVMLPSVPTYSITNGPLGQSTITVPAAAQQFISAGNYYYTLRFVLASGSVSDQNYGSWMVRKTAFG